ncbi:EexN family lipoprotein [Haemophilus haemolyticus]|uniref:EexN family lipoprotein n=1 Tax=Haemophilus haemolyticus TaxID=726 RepID=UPI00112951E8|nr:EexN family lipoprotein [Haemophilus haemolyticus]TPH00593.1 hypothetical protein EUX51_08020 [Haemophilus haemolyticus]
MKKTSILLCSIFLVACSEQTITVEQFKSDQVLLNKYLEKCKNGELHKEDINCINANQANKLLVLEEERKQLLSK